MNNFRKLLKKIEDIVANTTKEDIQKAIDTVEICDILKENNLNYSYEQNEVNEYSYNFFDNVDFTQKSNEYEFSYYKSECDINVHIEMEDAA